MSFFPSPITQSIFKTHLLLNTNNGTKIITTNIILRNPFHIRVYQHHHRHDPTLFPRSFVSPMSSLNQPNNNKTVRVVVKGRVQGVFYRNWTIENATELGLRGWVRNRRDGSVEALFSGSPDKVQEMEERCRRGPPSAMVTALEVSPCSDDPGTVFERRQTI